MLKDFADLMHVLYGPVVAVWLVIIFTTGKFRRSFNVGGILFFSGVALASDILVNYPSVMPYFQQLAYAAVIVFAALFIATFPENVINILRTLVKYRS